MQIVLNLDISKVGVIMLKTIDYYASLINGYDNQDLISCNYDHKQHSINMYCYIRDLYSSIKNDFDISKDDIKTLRYVERMVIDARSDMNFRNRIAS